MATANFCSMCGEKIQPSWKFCMSCGESLQEIGKSMNGFESPETLMSQFSSESNSLEPSKNIENNHKKNSILAAVSILIAIFIIVGIFLANKVEPTDFAKRLNKASEYTWVEDQFAGVATNDRFVALRGFKADNCNVYIYESEARALDSAKNYLTSKMYWWGTDDKTGYGVVIADQGYASACTDQAADAFGWTLDH